MIETTVVRKRIGFIMLTVISLVILSHVLKDLFVYHVSFLRMLQNPAIVVLIPLLPFIIWSTFVDSRVSLLIQVAMFFIIAVGSIFDTYYSFYGVGSYLIGSILLYKYGFLERRQNLKIILLIIFYFACTEAAAQLQEPWSAWLGFDAILYLGLYLAFIWIVYEKELRSLLLEKRQLEKEISTGKPYRDLGENVGGLIHNLKSDLSVILGTLTLYEQGKIDSLEPLELGATRLSERINNITGIIRAQSGSGDTVVNATAIVRGVIEFFRSANDAALGVDFNQDLPDHLPVFGSSDEITQVIENIVKNSLEAVRESGRAGSVRIIGSQDGTMSWISIADNAGPMPMCAQCTLVNCLSCELIGEGKTTKETGSGIGLAYVKKVMKRIGGDMRIHSGPTGVQTVLVFRRTAPSATEATLGQVK